MFFAGLAGYGDVSCQQYTSNFIIEPNDAE